MNQKNQDIVRVLHITNEVDRAGAETMLMNYYRCINRKKVQFDFLINTPLSYKCDYEDEIIEKGGMVFHLPRLMPRTLWKYLKAAKFFFKEHPEYRIVHAHNSAIGVIPLYIAKKNKIPIRIAHSHNTRGGTPLKHFITSILKLFLRHVGTYFFACGTDAAEWLYGKKLVRQKNVLILKNAIPASLYSYNEKKRSLIRTEKGWNDSFVVGHVGRFAYQKNHGFLLDIFKNIKLLCPHALLLLIGDGKDRESIEEKIKIEGLEGSVILVGKVENISDYMQAMDVFLFPSRYEGLGMALVEAQATGLQCFTSEMVPQEAAITDLVEYIPLSKDSEYWANRVIRYKNGYLRRNTYNEIRKASYDIQQNAEWLENYYIELFNSIEKS